MKPPTPTPVSRQVGGLRHPGLPATGAAALPGRPGLARCQPGALGNRRMHAAAVPRARAGGRWLAGAAGGRHGGLYRRRAVRQGDVRRAGGLVGVQCCAVVAARPGWVNHNSEFVIRIRNRRSRDVLPGVNGCLIRVIAIHFQPSDCTPLPSFHAFTLPFPFTPPLGAQFLAGAPRLARPATSWWAATASAS
jgi:hypothetical protein